MEAPAAKLNVRGTELSDYSPKIKKILGGHRAIRETKAETENQQTSTANSEANDANRLNEQPRVGLGTKEATGNTVIQPPPEPPTPPEFKQANSQLQEQTKPVFIFGEDERRQGSAIDPRVQPVNQQQQQPTIPNTYGQQQSLANSKPRQTDSVISSSIPSDVPTIPSIRPIANNQNYNNNNNNSVGRNNNMDLSRTSGTTNLPHNSNVGFVGIQSKHAPRQEGIIGPSKASVLSSTTAPLYDNALALEQIQHERERLEVTLYDLTQKIRSINCQKNRELNSHVSVLEREGRNIDLLSSKMYNISKNLETLKEKEVLLKTDVKEYEERQRKLGTRIQTNQMILEEIGGENDRIQQELKQTKAKIVDSEIELEGIVEEINKIVGEIDETKSNVEVLNSTNIKLNFANQKNNEIELEKLKLDSKRNQLEISMNQKLNELNLRIQNERKINESKKNRISELRDLYNNRKGRKSRIAAGAISSGSGFFDTTSSGMSLDFELGGRGASAAEANSGEMFDGLEDGKIEEENRVLMNSISFIKSKMDSLQMKLKEQQANRTHVDGIGVATNNLGSFVGDTGIDANKVPMVLSNQAGEIDNVTILKTEMLKQNEELLQQQESKIEELKAKVNDLTLKNSLLKDSTGFFYPPSEDTSGARQDIGRGGMISGVSSFHATSDSIDAKSIELELKLQDLQNEKNALKDEARLLVENYQNELSELYKQSADLENISIQRSAEMVMVKNENFKIKKELQQEFDKLASENIELNNKITEVSCRQKELEDNNNTELTILRDNFEKDRQVNADEFNKLSAAQKDLDQSIVSLKNKNDGLSEKIEDIKRRIQDEKTEKEVILGEINTIRNMSIDGNLASSSIAQSSIKPVEGPAIPISLLSGLPTDQSAAPDALTTFSSETFQTKVANLKLANARALKEIAEEEQQINSIKMSIENTETELKTAKASKVSQMSEKVEGLKNKIKDLAEEYKRIQKELEVFERDNGKDGAGSSDESKLKEMIASDEKLKSLVERSDSMREKVEKLKETIKEENSKLEQNIDKLNKLNSEINEIESNGNTKRTDFEKMRLDVKDKMAKISNKINDLLERETEETQRFSVQKNSLLRELDRLANKQADIKSRIEQEETNFANEKKKNENTLNSLQDKEGFYKNNLKTLVEGNNEKKQELEETLNTHTSKLAELRDACNDLKTKISGIRDDVLNNNFSVKDEINKINRLKMERNQTINQLRKEVDILKSTLEDDVNNQIDCLLNDKNVFETQVRKFQIEKEVYLENTRLVNSQLYSTLHMEACANNNGVQPADSMAGSAGAPNNFTQTQLQASGIVMDCSLAQSQLQDAQNELEGIVERVAQKNQELLVWQRKIGENIGRSVSASADNTSARPNMNGPRTPFFSPSLSQQQFRQSSPSARSRSPKSVTSIPPSSPSAKSLYRTHNLNSEAINKILQSIETLKRQLKDRQNLLEKTEKEKSFLLGEKTNELELKNSEKQKIETEIGEINGLIETLKTDIDDKTKKLKSLNKLKSKALTENRNSKTQYSNSEKLLNRKSEELDSVADGFAKKIETIRLLITSLRLAFTNLQDSRLSSSSHKTLTEIHSKSTMLRLLANVATNFTQNMLNIYSQKNNSLMEINNRLHSIISDSFSTEVPANSASGSKEEASPLEMSALPRSQSQGQTARSVQTPISSRFLNKITASQHHLVESLEEAIKQLTFVMQRTVDAQDSGSDRGDEEDPNILLESLNSICSLLHSIADDNSANIALMNVINNYKTNGIPSLEMSKSLLSSVVRQTQSQTAPQISSVGPSTSTYKVINNIPTQQTEYKVSLMDNNDSVVLAQSKSDMIHNKTTSLNQIEALSLSIRKSNDSYENAIKFFIELLSRSVDAFADMETPSIDLVKATKNVVAFVGGVYQQLQAVGKLLSGKPQNTLLGSAQSQNQNQSQMAQQRDSSISVNNRNSSGSGIGLGSIVSSINGSALSSSSSGVLSSYPRSQVGASSQPMSLSSSRFDASLSYPRPQNSMSGQGTLTPRYTATSVSGRVGTAPSMAGTHSGARQFSSAYQPRQTKQPSETNPTLRTRFNSY